MNQYETLLSRVHLVRRQWRAQVWVKGISLFLAASIALLVLGVWGADLFGFRPLSVWAMRFITGAAVLFVAVRFLIYPLSRRVTDVQIAQFIEEHYPHLEDRLVSAVEFGQAGLVPEGMLDLLIKDALDKIGRIDFSVFVDRRRLAYFGGLGIAAVLALYFLLSWGPSFFPYGFNRLYVPWTSASIGAPMMITVTPGNLELAKGSDAQIRAQLVGYDSPDVKLYVQNETATVWTPIAMEPEPRGSGFLYLLIDVQSSLNYYVEAKGIRSQSFMIKVLDLPKIERIDLTYNFPAYTGMAPQTVENEGDISALKGTKVDIKIHASRPAQNARLQFDDRSTLDLARAGTQDFTGSITLRHSGSYVVQFAGQGFSGFAGSSSEYEIEALDDMPPKVSITKPMRDVRATNVEEVFSEIKAEDDIGMGKVELRYSVNGAPEKSLQLYNGKPRETVVTAPHTFFMEEFGLQPGDVISYYGWALDNNNVTGPGTASSDIYFIQVRPFEQKYKQSQQGGGGGGGDEAQENLSKQQKEIISATFKLIRDKVTMDPKEYVDSLKSLALVQGRLQAQAQGLVERLHRRGAASASADFAKLAEYLQNAIGSMESAAVSLGAQKPSEALPEEEKALQQLMRAESLFREIQVSFANQGSGKGQSNAEDLADLFELELNKLKNQYETVQRGEQQERDEKVDEALQRLKELAQRQQQLNERNRMMGAQGSSSSASSGAGQSQQQLMDEAEALKRQLQRLSRERSSPELNNASSQLQKAIDEMKKAIDRSQRGNGAEASSQGIRALQQLDDARRSLSRGQSGNLQQEMDQAVEESKKLVEEQNHIQEGLDRLSQDKNGASSPESQRSREELGARKSLLADRVKNLGNKIQGLSKQTRKEQKETSGKLDEAAQFIRDKRLPERILSGNPLLENGAYDVLKPREDFIRGSLEALNKQLEAAKSGLGETKEGKLGQAVNKTRELAEGLESMRNRMRNLQQGLGQQGSRGDQQAQQRGQAGQSQQSQSGQQAQSGQAGQSGRQPGGNQGSQGRGGQTPDSTQTGGRSGSQPGTREGMPNGDIQGMTANASGPPNATGRSRDEDVRQLQREGQQRLMDAQELRRLMNGNPTQTRNLDQVIESLRKTADTNYSDPERVARLKTSIDLLHNIEADLSRELERLTQQDKYFYAEDSEAPASYKKLVEEYYKALAKGK